MRLLVWMTPTIVAALEVLMVFVGTRWWARLAVLPMRHLERRVPVPERLWAAPGADAPATYRDAAARALDWTRLPRPAPPDGEIVGHWSATGREWLGRLKWVNGEWLAVVRVEIALQGDHIGIRSRYLPCPLLALAFVPVALLVWLPELRWMALVVVLGMIVGIPRRPPPRLVAAVEAFVRAIEEGLAQSPTGTSGTTPRAD